MDTRTAYERRWQALALLATTQFVVVLDAAIVNVALPSIGTALEFSQQDLQWVVNAYVLTFGGFLLLGGRAADLLGRRRMFILGLVVFALASLAGGLAQSDTQLIVARAVQGLGGAILAPAALSIVAATFVEGAERNKAMGVWGAVAGSGGAAGVLLGGVLTEWLGWEWVFWVNVPIALAAAFLAPRLIAESRDANLERRYDVAGAITVTAGLSILVYALVDAESAGWGSTQTIGLLALAVALLASFVMIELRSRQPLVPFRIFRNRPLLAANATMLVFVCALFAMFFFISLYMQQVLGFEPLEAGLAYLPLSAGIIIAAGVASQLTTRFGVKPVLLPGLALISVGLAVVQPDLGGRQLRGRRARPVGHLRGRRRHGVRPGHDRRGGGCRGARVGARQRAHQHVAADRRGDRPGGARHARQHAHGEHRGRGPPGRERPDRGLPARLPGRRRIRRARLRHRRWCSRRASRPRPTAGRWSPSPRPTQPDSALKGRPVLPSI